MIKPGPLYEIAATLGGMPVLGVLPNSPAAIAGIRYGDILLELNGHPTDNVDAYIDARAADVDRLTARIFRNGEEIEIVLNLPRRGSRAAVDDAAKQVVAMGALRPSADDESPPSRP